MTPEQLRILRTLAAEKNYGRGIGHATQVNKLSLDIYGKFIEFGFLKQASQDREILEAAALLHDIGLPEEPHNEVGFDLLKNEMPKLMAAKPLPLTEFSTILYCILWHRGVNFSKRGNIDITNPTYTSKMAAILRVADALDRTLQQCVEDVSAHLEGQRLIFTISSRHSIETEINRAIKKADLMKEAYSLKGVNFERAKR